MCIITFVTVVSDQNYNNMAIKTLFTIILAPFFIFAIFLWKHIYGGYGTDAKDAGFYQTAWKSDSPLQMAMAVFLTPIVLILWVVLYFFYPMWEKLGE